MILPSLQIEILPKFCQFSTLKKPSYNSSYSVSADVRRMYLLNSAQAACFVIAPWHLSGPHQISPRHAALLTRAAVMAGTNVPHPLPITAFFIKGMKAVNMLQDSHKWVAVENGGCECWEEGRVTLRWRLIGPDGGYFIINRNFAWILTTFFPFFFFFFWILMVWHTS